MKITKEAFEKIYNMVVVIPVETGGILGSTEEAINKVILDAPDGKDKSVCRYSPDIIFFNERIEQWQDENVSFKGIFHTHFFGVQTLSLGDKEYIKTIMKHMPDEIGALYFPIFVYPEKELVCYVAKRIRDEVLILSDILEII